MKLTVKRAILRCGLLVVSSSLLSGCFELNYPDVETLYETLGTNVQLIKTDQYGLISSTESVLIKDKLLNDDSVNDMENTETLDSNYYEYMPIKVTKTMDIGDFALFIKSEQSLAFTIRIFISDRGLDPLYVRSFKLPSSTDNIYIDEFKDPVGEISASLTASVWQSFYLNVWGKDGASESAKIEASQYFIIQFLNNTGYGADIGLKPVKFIPVNLMISPIKK